MPTFHKSVTDVFPFGGGAGFDGIGRCVQNELAGPTHSSEVMFSLKSASRLQMTTVNSDRKLVLLACEGPEALLLRVVILCHLVQYH